MMFIIVDNKKIEKFSIKYKLFEKEYNLKSVNVIIFSCLIIYAIEFDTIYNEYRPHKL